MQTPDANAEILILETQISHYKKLLDKAISDNVELARTKEIYHQLKELTDKLQKLSATVSRA